MKKYIANIITASRIVFSLPLLFLPLSSAWFYVFYLLCGLSDMVDGTVACKDSGASADSAEAQSLVAKLQAHSPPTTTPAQTRSSQVLARCTSAMSDSRRISTSTERELRNLRQGRSIFFCKK